MNSYFAEALLLHDEGTAESLFKVMPKFSKTLSKHQIETLVASALCDLAIEHSSRPRQALAQRLLQCAVHMDLVKTFWPLIVTLLASTQRACEKCNTLDYVSVAGRTLSADALSSLICTLANVDLEGVQAAELDSLIFSYERHALDGLTASESLDEGRSLHIATRFLIKKADPGNETCLRTGALLERTLASDPATAAHCWLLLLSKGCSEQARLVAISRLDLVLEKCATLGRFFIDPRKIAHILPSSTPMPRKSDRINFD